MTIYHLGGSQSIMTTRDSPTDLQRRRLLQGLGALSIASLAGCTTALGGGEESDAGQNSSDSIHWHPHLTIEIQGETQQIPSGIGIGSEYSDSPYYDSGMQMTSIHTHDASGTIHWEIMGRPPKDGELQLGAFFEIWGKPFSETQIFDYRSHEENEVTMVVNGTPNDDFANYKVNDGDDIVIQYD